MVMVLKALESGVPIKSQNQIVLMQQRYLEQRAKEMVLSELAVQRGIKLSEKDLYKIMDDYMKTLGFTGYSTGNILKLGLTDETHLRDYLRRREILKQFITEINNGLEGNDKVSTLRAEIDEYYKNSGIRIFPEHLQRPLAE
jgi:hypothetical protein